MKRILAAVAFLIMLVVVVLVQKIQPAEDYSDPYYDGPDCNVSFACIY